MEELYKKNDELLEKIEKKIKKVVRHYSNNETKYGNMPEWFMKDLLKIMKLLKELNVIILRQEKDTNAKAKYLNSEISKLDKLFSLRDELPNWCFNDELVAILSIMREVFDMCFYNLGVAESSMTLEMSNQNMSLYMMDGDEVNKRYAIFLNDLQVCIGEIGCSEIEYRNEKKLNVFCRIFSDFRGHNYALNALNLMAEGLYQRGVNSLYFLTNSTNVSAIKSVEKFGAIMIGQYNGEVSYEADLVKIFGSKKSSISM